MAGTLSGCMGGFLNVNNDPYLVSEPTLAFLLTGLERQLVYPDNVGNINMVMPSITNHLAQRELDNYSMVPNISYMTNTWMYLNVMTVKQSEVIVERATAQDCMQYAGIAKLMRAYVYMNMVDLWGDIPYTEANNIEIFQPMPDPSADIYNDLLLQIDEARADIANDQSENLLVPTSDDLIYGGNMGLWVRFANTLELKMLVQSRKAKGQITNWQGRLNALLATPDFLQDGQDFQFPHSATRAPADERHQSYVAEYAGGQKSYHPSPWFYEIMKGYTAYNFPDNPMAGIEDPRIPYYFVNQATPATVTTNATDYRDGGFISIMYNSNSPYAASSQERYMTCVGIYPVGGRFDDGATDPDDDTLGIEIGEGSGTGIAPNKMLQAYSVPFMMAELILTEGVAGDAAAQLEEGIRRSFYHINAVCAAAAGSAAVPALSDDAFITAVVDAFDAASDERKMEILMTQKWIANFYNSFEAYADIRRTGYPRLMFDVTGTNVQSPYRQQTEPEAGPASYTLRAIAEFPRIIYYSSSEVAANRNITNTGRVVSAYGNVFWDVQ